MAHRHHGRCPACRKIVPLSRHHVMPIRHYGKGKHNEHIVLLCRPCHNELEILIPLKERLPTWKYFAIVAKFIKEKSNAEMVDTDIPPR